MDAPLDHEVVEAAIRRWLERAVIGLNLCPFAKAVYVKKQVRIVISDASTERALLEADTSRKRRAEIIDNVAAGFILQGMLDRLGHMEPRHG